MNDHRPEPGPDDYLLLPSVTHPGGRERAFKDAYKAMVRFMIEVKDNPTIANRRPSVATNLRSLPRFCHSTPLIAYRVLSRAAANKVLSTPFFNAPTFTSVIGGASNAFG